MERTLRVVIMISNSNDTLPFSSQVTLQLRNSFQGVQPFGIAVTDSETNSVNRSHESSEESKPSAPVASYSVGGGGGGEETSSRSNATVAVKGGLINV